MQAGAQLPRDRRVLGQEPLAVIRPAGFQVRQVGLQHTAQFGVERCLGIVTSDLRRVSFLGHGEVSIWSVVSCQLSAIHGSLSLVTCQESLLLAAGR